MIQKINSGSVDKKNTPKTSINSAAKNPADIILPTLIVTTISFIVTILAALVLKKLWRKYD